MRGLLPALFYPQKAHSKSSTQFRVMYCVSGTGLEVQNEYSGTPCRGVGYIKEQKNDHEGEEPYNG